MTHTIVSDMETINKLYRPGKVQKDVILFHESSDRVWRMNFEPFEYKDVRSAQTSYHNAIKRLGMNMRARILDGKLYLIKLVEGD